MRLLKRIFVKPVTIIFAIVIAVVLGVFSTSKMAVNLLPDISFPFLAIQTSYVGADAETIDEEVTLPLEKAISNISGIHEISTYSIDNASIIVVQFDYGTDILIKESDIYNKIDNVKLPEGVGEPNISNIDLNATSLYSLTIYSDTKDMHDVYIKAMEIERQLNSIKGVANVKLSGAPIVSINVDTINGLEMFSGLIVKELKTNSSLDIPLGDIFLDGEKISINNHSKTETIDDIKNSIVSLELQETQITAFKRVQNTIDKIERMNVEELMRLKEDADKMNEFIDELEKSTNEELDEMVSNLSLIKSFVTLITNYSSASLKLMWSSTLKSLFENEDFKNMSEQELHNLASDLNVSYDIIKWLHDNAEINPETGKTYAEEKWMKIVDFRKANENEDGGLNEDFTDDKYADLFYDLEILSSDPSSEDYMAREDIKDAVELSREINTVALENVVEKIKDGEEVTNQEYASLFIYRDNEYDIPLTSQTIRLIRSKYFEDNYEVFYNYKVQHEHEETELNEETGEEVIVKVGDDISSKDFMALYDKMLFEEEIEMKPTERLLDFIRNADLTSSSIKTKVNQIADVYLNTKYESKAYYNSKGAIQIDVFGEGNSNNTSIANEAKKIINKFNMENEEYNFVSLNNQSDFINDSISNALVSLLIGCFLAIIVIYLFLREIKSSLIIALSMPLSVLLTLVCLYAMGVTLNMVSIGGIAVGIGMLVDNSIVVLESITSEKEKGKSVLESSLQGVKLVLGSLIGSTLTSICVFFPILFISGLTKEIFADLAWAVILSLSFSLLVSVTVIPTLFCLFFKKNKTCSKESKVFKKLNDWYVNKLVKILKNKGISIVVILGVFLASIGLIFVCPVEFLPSIDQHKIQLNINFEAGTNDDYCHRKTYEAYEIIMDNIENIEYISQNVGYSGLIETSKSGVITLQLTNEAKKSKLVCEDIRNVLIDNNFSERFSIAELDGVVASLTGGMSGVSVSLLGENVETLKEIANKIEEDVMKKEGVKQASDNMLSSSKSYNIKINQEKLIENGIDYSSLVQTLRIGLAGYEIYEIIDDDIETSVVVSWNGEAVGEYYKDINSLIVGIKQDGDEVSFVHLEDVAKINEELGRHVIRKVNGKNVLSISIEHFGIDTNTATKYLKESTDRILSNYEGYSYLSGGVSYYLTDAFSGLFIALLISFFLLFGVMACLFESFRKPIIIIFSFPFAFTGGFIALAISRVSVNVVSFIGLIMLMGVIINDAIVLNERFDQLRESNLSPQEAVIEGARQRLRPVLMTTLTTVLALIPMALGVGKGGELMSPLGVVAIGGMTLGTIVTLVLIPCAYALIYRIDFRKNNKEKENNV